MKSIVIYSSLTGNTKQVAETIASGHTMCIYVETTLRYGIL